VRKLAFTLREEHRVRIFENKMLRRNFRTKMEEIAGRWRRLHSEELNGFSPHRYYNDEEVMEDEIGGV